MTSFRSVLAALLFLTLALAGCGGGDTAAPPPSGSAPHFLHGSVVDPAPGQVFPFLANGWFSGRAGRIKMSTAIPAFGAGQADVALYTARDSTLGRTLNANRTGFPLLSVRGKFAYAVMTVTLSR